MYIHILLHPHNREINVNHIPQSPETQQALGNLCEEYKDIFSLNQGDIGDTKLLTMYTDTGDHPLIVQKPYMLPLKYTQWVLEELEILEKAGIISPRVSSWLSPIVILPKKAQLGEQPQRNFCTDY